MRISSRLPDPPKFDLEIVFERKAPPGTFLRSVHRVCRTRDQEGRVSREFLYDEVDREALDAVVIVPHFLVHGPESDHAEHHVVLRSALRPPVVLRERERSPIAQPGPHSLWEVPAGLVEESSGQQEDIVQAAARELLEETGFQSELDQLHSLGPPSFPSPGVIAERHFFFRVEVDPTARLAPLLDGSPLEEAGELIAVPLSCALEAAAEGRLADAKTELALRRLYESLEGKKQ
jgi:ADP-ribose pyrophosphatase